MAYEGTHIKKTCEGVREFRFYELNTFDNPKMSL